MRHYLVAAFFLTGCAPAADFDLYQKAITDFQDATTIVSTAATESILSVRAEDQDRILADLKTATNPCDVVAVRLRAEAGAGPADCAVAAAKLIEEGRFSEEALQARREAFEVMAEYSAFLSSVASDDVPTRWRAALQSLGTSVAGLVETLEDSQAQEDPGTIQQLVGTDGSGPLTQIASRLSEEIWLNPKRTEILDAAVTRINPQIKRISALLREDFTAASQSRALFATREKNALILAYGDAVDAATNVPTQDDEGNPLTDAAIEKAQKAADKTREEALLALNTFLRADEMAAKQRVAFVAVMDSFDKAIDGLTTYARSDKTREDLAQFIYLTDRYAQLTKQFLEITKEED